MTYSNKRIIKNKVGLLNLAEELVNISGACKIMGFSRETFQRSYRARGEGELEALLDKNCRKPNLKSRVDESIEIAVKEVVFKFPSYGQLRASNKLRKRGLFVPLNGVRSICLPHTFRCLKTTLECFRKISGRGRSSLN